MGAAEREVSFRGRTLWLAVGLLSGGPGGCADSGAGFIRLNEAATFEPASLDFSEVVVGTSRALRARLVNVGTAALLVESVEVASPFSVDGLQDSTIAPGDSRPFDVTFAPSDPGAHSAALAIAIGEGVLELPMAGVAVLSDAGPLILVPASLDFGVVEVGEGSELVVALENAGRQAVEVDAVVMEASGVSPGLDADFRLRSDFPLRLGPAETSTRVLEFWPSEVGRVTEVLRFVSRGSRDPVLTVTGEGRSAEGGLFCDPPSVQFGRVARGMEVTAQMACRARGGALRVERVRVVDGTSALRFLVDPTGLELIAEERFDLTVAFTAAGVARSFLSAIRIDYALGDGTGSVTVPVSAEIEAPRVDRTDLRAVVEWDSAGTDVDLHLVRSDGALFSPEGDDCYYANRSPEWGSSTTAIDNPFLDRDDTDGFGPEVVNLQRAPPDRYRVYVHYFSDRSRGATTAHLRLQLNGGADAFSGSRSLDCNAAWFIGTVDWSRGRGAFVLEDRVEAIEQGTCAH